MTVSSGASRTMQVPVPAERKGLVPDRLQALLDGFGPLDPLDLAVGHQLYLDVRVARVPVHDGQVVGFEHEYRDSLGEVLAQDGVQPLVGQDLPVLRLLDLDRLPGTGSESVPGTAFRATAQVPGTALRAQRCAQRHRFRA